MANNKPPSLLAAEDRIWQALLKLATSQSDQEVASAYNMIRDTLSSLCDVSPNEKSWFKEGER
jgi:uncharacterized damage-inducible protein DinB